MHKILLNNDARTSIEHQKRLNSMMKDVVKKEVLKWLNVGFIYAISDSRLVPKKCYFEPYLRYFLSAFCALII